MYLVYVECTEIFALLHHSSYAPRDDFGVRARHMSTAKHKKTHAQQGARLSHTVYKGQKGMGGYVMDIIVLVGTFG